MWGGDPKPAQMPWGLHSKGLLGKSAPSSAPYPLALPVPPVVAVLGRHLAVQ